MLPVSFLVPSCPGLHEFPQLQVGAGRPFPPCLWEPGWCPALPAQGPCCCVGPGVGLLVPSAFPISHTSTLYISGSQEESGVGAGISALGSSVSDFTWWEGRT